MECSSSSPFVNFYHKLLRIESGCVWVSRRQSSHTVTIPQMSCMQTPKCVLLHQGKVPKLSIRKFVRRVLHGWSPYWPNQMSRVINQFQHPKRFEMSGYAGRRETRLIFVIIILTISRIVAFGVILVTSPNCYYSPCQRKIPEIISNSPVGLRNLP